MTNSSMKLVALVFISVVVGFIGYDPIAQFIGSHIAALARVVGQ